jgi:hypothetical protein
MSPANFVDPPVATYAVERVTVATNLAYQKLIGAPHGTRSKRNLAPWPARTV